MSNTFMHQHILPMYFMALMLYDKEQNIFIYFCLAGEQFSAAVTLKARKNYLKPKLRPLVVL